MKLNVQQPAGTPKIRDYWSQSSPQESASLKRPFIDSANAIMPNDGEDNGRPWRGRERPMTIEEIRSWWRYQNDPRNKYPRELAEHDLKAEKERRAKNPDQYWWVTDRSHDEEITRIQRTQESLHHRRQRDCYFDRER